LYEGQRLAEIKVLSITFEPRKKEVTEGWRKLHNEELHIEIIIESLQVHN
jgi:hypothetical protein